MEVKQLARVNNHDRFYLFCSGYRNIPALTKHKINNYLVVPITSFSNCLSLWIMIKFTTLASDQQFCQGKKNTVWMDDLQEFCLKAIKFNSWPYNIMLKGWKRNVADLILFVLNDLVSYFFFLALAIPLTACIPVRLLLCVHLWLISYAQWI